MKSGDLYIAFLFMLLTLLIGIWVGAGLGVASCMALKDEGYTHGFFKSKVYCENTKEKE